MSADFSLREELSETHQVGQSDNASTRLFLTHLFINTVISYCLHCCSNYHGVKADVVYRCETCQQTFANQSNLKIHEKHVHSTERLFTCDRCEKTFKRKKDVVRHQRQVRRVQGPQPLLVRCHIEKNNQTNPVCQVHERSNLQYTCSDCGKSLSSKTALVLHQRTHTGMRPFECTDCQARFTQNSALKMHRRYRDHPQGW